MFPIPQKRNQRNDRKSKIIEGDAPRASPSKEDIKTYLKRYVASTLNRTDRHTADDVTGEEYIDDDYR